MKYIFIAVVLSLACYASALKEDECEGMLNYLQFQLKMLFNVFFFTLVCVKTVQKFSDSLSADVKKDTKKIEAEFKTFCKTSKNKENRFVSISIICSF